MSPGFALAKKGKPLASKIENLDYLIWRSTLTRCHMYTVQIDGSYLYATGCGSYSFCDVGDLRKKFTLAELASLLATWAKHWEGCEVLIETV
jgi:hypothetical protein